MAAQTGADGNGELPLDLVEVTVAEGRTLHHDGKRYGPGEQFEIDGVEAKRLRLLGFLVDPGAKAIPKGDGPQFEPEAGPKVKKAKGA